MKSQLKIGSILSYLILLIQTISTIVFTPILLKYLGQTEYGIYLVLGALISYLSVFDFGFGNATIRYIAKIRSEKKSEKIDAFFSQMFYFFLFIGLLILVIGLLMTPWIENILSIDSGSNINLNIELIFIILIINLALTFPFSTFGSTMAGYEQFILPRILIIVRIILSPLIMYILLLNGHGVLTLVILNTILNFSTNIVNVFYVLNILKVKILKFKIDKVLFKEISSYSLFIFLGLLGEQFFWNSGQIIISFFKGPNSVVEFAIAIQLINMFIKIPRSLNSLILPKVTKMLYSQSREIVFNFFVTVSKIQLSLLSVVVITYFIVGKDFIILWLGKDYSNVWIYSMIMMLFLFPSLTMLTGVNILQAKKLHGKFSVFNISLAILAMLTSVLVIQYIGIIGVVVSVGFFHFISNTCFVTLYLQKILKINMIKYWGKMARLIVTGALLTALFSYLKEKYFFYTMDIMAFLIISLLLILGISIAIYIIGLNKEEKKYLRGRFI